MTTTNHQSQLIRADDGGLQKIVYRSAISADDDDTLSIESKKFHLRDQSQFLVNYREVGHLYSATAVVGLDNFSVAHEGIVLQTDLLVVLLLYDH